MGILLSRLRRLCAAITVALPLAAQTAITVGTPEADYPSYTTIGVKLPISGDTDYDAAVAVRYRLAGSSTWLTALPLFRPRPETVFGFTVAPHFAGSVFDLRPAQSYEMELTVTDPDGGSVVKNITINTLGLPTGPTSPRIVNVSTSAQLQAALDAALPGDVITLADGVYTGLAANEFRLDNSGNAANPIVIRGTNASRAIIDGQGCNCIALMIFSSGFVQVENLTIRNAARGIRFFGAGASDFLVRRVVTYGVDSPVFSLTVAGRVTVSDNIFHGPLVWPQIFATHASLFGIKEGISLSGNGNIIAHNRIHGFADAMNFRSWGHRGHDIYGNDIYDAFDNAVELDSNSGNTRMLRNRATNAFMPFSVQPTLGGPAYLMRNEAFNVAFEPFKFHALANTVVSETSGNLAYHNTTIGSDYAALGIETPHTTHNFEIKNNVFFGAPVIDYVTPPRPVALSWGTPVNFGVFDYNAYHPDGLFWWKEANGTNRQYVDFAAMRAANDVMERNGRVVSNATMFARGATLLSDYTVRYSPQSVSLAPGAQALDVALALPNVNNGFTGAGPDLGARELGCATPWFGPRPVGMDESNQRRGCEPAPAQVGTAVFSRIDSATKGDWPMRYGSVGFAVAGGDSNLGTSFSTNGATEIWQTPTSLLKAPRRARTTGVRSAAGWVNEQDLYVTLDLGSTPRQLDLYLFEMGNTSVRRQIIEVYDANYNLLDVRNLDNFVGGQHVIWQASGRLRIRLVQHIGSASTVLSAVLVD